MIIKMNILSVVLLIFTANVWARDCSSKKSNSKLVCYYSKLTDINSCECSHIILPVNSDVKSIDRLKENLTEAKVLISVNEFNQGLVNLLQQNKVDGVEIDLKKLNSKEDINDFISTVRSKLGSNLIIALSVPTKTDLLAKYFDFKSLSKTTDLFILQTSFLGANTNVTFHPSRLSGLWDMQNTDSVVDLVSGLGAPVSKLVISAPVQAYQFTLQNSEYTAPGSPALEIKSITRDELCTFMKNENDWTLERDQDQAGPYIFSGNKWIAFEDSISMDVKAKYSRVRGLAGIALKDVSQDGGSKCEVEILESAYNGLSRQARAPRGAVLQSLKREIVETISRPFDNIQVSPYRITRVIDTKGHINIIRQDTRTEFECSRQGYFVHPRSCNRFYRCVKFNQLSEEFSVFEFDCPAGLAFDERVEVCVWPGSLPHASACAGSSEIAPVPKNRFICPSEPGYYADPENCRWFFACLDHGTTPLTAYEFRCPFGLVFDQDRLICEWPWIVPKCGNGEAYGVALAQQSFYGSTTLLGYNGLGSLNVKLDGLSGNIVQPVAKIYSNARTVGLSNIELNKARLLQSSSDSDYGYRSTLSKGLKITTATNDNLYNLNGNIPVSPVTGSIERIQESSVGDLVINHQVNQNSGKNSESSFIGINNNEFNYITNENNGNTQSNFNNVIQLGSFGTNVQGQNNINIVGQGHSVVGIVDNKKPVIGQNFLNRFSYLNPTSILVNPTISTVTSVPIPFIKTSSNFQSIKGGVVANTPQLQFKLGTTPSSLIYNTETIQPVLSEHSIKVESNPATLIQIDEKLKDQPVIQIQNLAQSTSDRIQNENNGGGYVYNKPLTTFEEGSQINAAVAGYNNLPIANSFNNIVSTGVINQEKSIPIIKTEPVSYVEDYKKVIQSIGYSYPKPNISFKYKQTIENKPIDYPVIEQHSLVNYGEVPTSTIQKIEQPSVQQKVLEQPLVTYSFKQQVSKYNNPIQVSDTNIQHINIKNPSVSVNQGYVYEKPKIKFEETPAGSAHPPILNYEQVNVGTDYVTPIINKPVLQTIVPIKSETTSINNQHFGTKIENIGYEYSKPAISFEEKPLLPEISSSHIPINPTIHIKEQIDVIPRPFKTPVKEYTESNIISQFSFGSIPILHDNRKPAVTVLQESKPLIPNDNYFISSTPKPFAKVDNIQISVTKATQPITIATAVPTLTQPSVQPTSEYKQPAIVTSYNYVNPSLTSKVIVKKLPQTVSESPVLLQPVQPITTEYKLPAVVSSYNYVNPSLTSQVNFEKLPQSVSESSVVIQPVRPITTEYKQPTVVSSYNYINPSLAPKVIVEKLPQTASESPVLVQSVEPIKTEYKQQAVVSSYNYVNPALPPKVIVENLPQTASESPVLVQSVQPIKTEYKQPAVVSSYSYVNPVQPIKTEYKQPAVVSSYSYVNPALAPEVIVQKLPQTASESPVLVQSVQPIKTEYKQPAVVSSYSYVNPALPPKVIVENLPQTASESPVLVQSVQPIKTEYKQPAVVSSYSYVNPALSSKGIVQKLPQTLPESPVLVQPIKTEYKQPAVVSSYSYVNPAVAPKVIVGKLPQTASESPVLVQSVQPVKTEYKQPAVVSSYSYVNPALTPKVIVENLPQTVSESPKLVQSVQPIQTEYKQQAIVSSYNYVNPALPPKVLIENLPQTASESPVLVQSIQPIKTKYKQPALVSSYSYVNPALSPKVIVEKLPPPALKSSVLVQPVQQHAQPITTEYKQPAVVSSYTYVNPTLSSKVIIEKLPQTASESSLVVQPVQTIKTEFKQPTVVSSYNYVNPYLTSKVIIGKLPQTTSRSPVLLQSITFKKAPIIESITPSTKTAEEYIEYGLPEYERQSFIEITSPKLQRVQSTTNSYYETRQPIKEVPFIKQKTYSTTKNLGYKYEKPVIHFTEEPIIPKNPQVSTFGTTEAAEDYKSIVDSNFYYIDKTKNVKYGAPVLIGQKDSYYSNVESTPKPSFTSTIASIIASEYPSSTIKPAVGRFSTPQDILVTTSRPIVRYSFSSLDETYQPDSTPLLKSVPIVSKTYIPRKQIVIPELKTVRKQFRPATTTVISPPREYLPVTTTISTPSRKYLPVTETKLVGRSRLRISSSTTAIPDNNDNIRVTSKRPIKVVKVIRPKTKTVIKENDFYPLISAKLGAQCTCVSNTVKIRKKPQKVIIVEDEENDDSEEFDDDNDSLDNEYIEKIDEDKPDAIIVEDYVYKKKGKIIDVTPTPEVYIKSTTTYTSKAPEYKVKKLLRIRPLSSTKATEIFIKNKTDATIKLENVTKDVPSDKEIVKAVRTGLKLVKQAAKEGAKEGAEQAISKSFDRYGPGGVRSRNERLQGTIDCQRAGLFRHPTQCNKFYSCRWDCKKNKFTLHVFNCPVYLTFDKNLGACNWPSQGPACVENTLLPSD